jgi:hypothetical protein
LIDEPRRYPYVPAIKAMNEALNPPTFSKMSSKSTNFKVIDISLSRLKENPTLLIPEENEFTFIVSYGYQVKIYGAGKNFKTHKC